jgi:hypothetical protein
MPIRQTLVGDPADAVDSASVDCASVRGAWRWDGVTFVLGNAEDGHACSLSIRAGAGAVRIPGEVDALVVEAVGHQWVVVSGRRARRAAARYARMHPELEAAQILSTADLGAIRVPLDSARGPRAPEAQRAHRRTLWSAAQGSLSE